MTTTTDPEPPTELRCPRCLWALGELQFRSETHKSRGLGMCPRCCTVAAVDSEGRLTEVDGDALQMLPVDTRRLLAHMALTRPRP